MTQLSPKRRSELRAEAHKLSPVVIIGDKGLTDEVLAEIDRSLKAHELIKVRAATDERDARDVWMATLCERLDAHPVQQIGKILVIYRENPEEKKAARSGPRDTNRPDKSGTPGGDEKAKSGARLRGDDNATRTSRRRSRTPSRPLESAPRRRRPRTSR